MPVNGDDCAFDRGCRIVFDEARRSFFVAKWKVPSPNNNIMRMEKKAKNKQAYHVVSPRLTDNHILMDKSEIKKSQ